jgi:ribosomal protein L11 methylase PrmA
MGKTMDYPEDCIRLTSSFRDPAGYLFRREGILYRRITPLGEGDYDRLKASGLATELVERGLLLSFEEKSLPGPNGEPNSRALKPTELPFISYPYEWCFGQLKAAALTTLAVQQAALTHGVTLKDASAFNIQFNGYSPVLIDHLSFTTYHENQPWVAYHQFCRHFLAPLALMAYVDIRIGRLFRAHLDGLPLDLTSRLLPHRTLVRLPLLLHIHFHAFVLARSKTRNTAKASRPLLKDNLIALLRNLEKAIRQLHVPKKQTVWSNYYDEHWYSRESFEHKRQIVFSFLDQLSPGMLWDLGTNTGDFIKLKSNPHRYTVAIDDDPLVIEQLYRDVVAEKKARLLPLCIDLTNPSPALGWNSCERDSLQERGPADAVLALALVHHLSITNSIPLDLIALFLSKLCHQLLIEFVPETDPQVQEMLSSREGHTPEYSEPSFEAAFGQFFRINRRIPLRNTGRVLYQMTGRM